ncbi:hypothetical protein D9M69_656610 [compost metagenome]
MIPPHSAQQLLPAQYAAGVLDQGPCHDEFTGRKVDGAPADFRGPQVDVQRQVAAYQRRSRGHG